MSRDTRYQSLVPDGWESQQRIKARAFCPKGTFTEFSKAEIEQSIADRFTNIASAYPGRIAITETGRTITYAEVDSISRCIAQSIIATCQAGPKPVVLLHENQAAMILSILGGFKAGKICVPVDPAFHGNRAALIARDSEPELIVTDGKLYGLAEQLSEGQIPIINIDALRSNLHILKPWPSPGPDALAYLLYTSGTTGKPKGVVQNHRNFLHDMRGYTNSFHICAEDRMTLFASCSGAQGLKTSFSALLNGATICLWNLRSNGFGGLRKWLVSENITMLMSSPTVFRNFTGTLDDDVRFSNIRLIKLGSEPVLAGDVNLYRKHFAKDCVLINWFSSTETGNLTCYFIDMDTQVAEKIVPVGYPIADKLVLLLSESGTPVEAGQIGEFAVKSRFVPLGYWTEGGIAARHPIAEPITQKAGSNKIYRTGDLGLMRSDGCLIHLGRKDSQTKILGRWVRLDDVESALLAQTEIKQVAVIAQEDPSGDKSLIIYLVATKGASINTTRIRQVLHDLLPEPTIPNKIVIMADLPLTANGKVDRQALSHQVGSRPHGTPYTAPRTPLEETLAGIWAEVLSVKRVGIHDNFFDLGGHSLIVARLHRVVESRCGRILPLNSVLRAPTIDQFVGLLNSHLDAQPASSLVPLQPEGSKRPFFCVHEFFGDVLCYLHLARCIDPERPFYALQPPSLFGTEPPFEQIEAMAAFYIKQIREIQAHGPYALGGFCSGGVIAFEMAQQLAAAGEKVDFLALLNSSCKARKSKIMRPRFIVDFFRGLPQWSIGALQLTRSEWRELVYLKIKLFKALLTKLRRREKSRRRRSDFAPLITVMGNFLHLSEKHLEFAQAQYRALRNYRPKSYPGRATLFRSLMQPLLSWHNPQKGWDDVITGDIDIKNMPGNQLSMLKNPHVKVLANELRFCLDKADSALLLDNRPESVII